MPGFKDMAGQVAQGYAAALDPNAQEAPEESTDENPNFCFNCGNPMKGSPESSETAPPEQDEQDNFGV